MTMGWGEVDPGREARGPTIRGAAGGHSGHAQLRRNWLTRRLVVPWPGAPGRMVRLGRGAGVRCVLILALDKDESSSTEANTLIADCKLMLESFQLVNINHVLREGNQCADYLANLGQTSAWGTTLCEDPPDALQVLLDRDKRQIATSRRR
nr:uncharacterized protein LOC109150206 [Ipomoea trifida]